MICASCARGADAATLVIPETILNRELSQALARIAEDGHRLCRRGTWCDCRHRPIEVKR